MYDINFTRLQESHIDTIFLNYAAVDFYGEDNISKWIQTANNNGVKVHIWMQVLYNDDFVNPLNNGTLNIELLNNNTEDAQRYANITGVSGIVLDYIRYPGTASENPGGSQAINFFVDNLTKTIKNVNPNLIVSGTLMPEETMLLVNYGQNLSNLSSTLDCIIPMMYKGNYEQNATWIESTTQYFVSNSEGAKVIISLQTYDSDYNITELSADEFTNDINAAYAGGAGNIGIFRYGLTNLENLDNTLTITNFINTRLHSLTNPKI